MASCRRGRRAIHANVNTVCVEHGAPVLDQRLGERPHGGKRSREPPLPRLELVLAHVQRAPFLVVDAEPGRPSEHLARDAQGRPGAMRRAVMTRQ